MGSRKKSWPFYSLVLTSSQTMPCDCNQKYESLVLIFLSWHYSIRKVMRISLKLPWGNFSQHMYFWRFTKLYTETFCLQKKKVSEDEMAGWHHRCNGHELGQTSGDAEGERGLVYCSLGVSKGRTQLGDWTTTTHSLWFGKTPHPKILSPLCYLNFHHSPLQVVGSSKELEASG